LKEVNEMSYGIYFFGKHMLYVQFYLNALKKHLTK